MWEDYYCCGRRSGAEGSVAGGDCERASVRRFSNSGRLGELVLELLTGDELSNSAMVAPAVRVIGSRAIGSRRCGRRASDW